MQLQFYVLFFFRMLIEYTEDKTEYEEIWMGYVFAGSMFVSATLQSLVLQQYFHIMVTLGMKIRSAVIGLIYEKVSKKTDKTKTKQNKTTTKENKSNDYLISPSL